MCLSVLQDIVAQADETPTTLYVSEEVTSGVYQFVSLLSSSSFSSLPFSSPLFLQQCPPLLSFHLLSRLFLLPFPPLSSLILPFPPPPPQFLPLPFSSFPSPICAFPRSLFFRDLSFFPLLFIQFEGGLKVTSTVVRGIFALAARVKNTPAISGVSLPSKPQSENLRKYVTILLNNSPLCLCVCPQRQVVM